MQLHYTVPLFVKLVTRYLLLGNIDFLARLHEVQKSYCSHHGRRRSHSRSRHTLLKFSRSLYLDNHSSESIHTWTIDALYGWLSFHDIRPQGPCQGVGLEVKI